MFNLERLSGSRPCPLSVMLMFSAIAHDRMTPKQFIALYWLLVQGAILLTLAVSTHTKGWIQHGEWHGPHGVFLIIILAAMFATTWFSDSGVSTINIAALTGLCGGCSTFLGLLLAVSSEGTIIRALLATALLVTIFTMAGALYGFLLSSQYEKTTDLLDCCRILIPIAVVILALCHCLFPRHPYSSHLLLAAVEGITVALLAAMIAETLNRVRHSQSDSVSSACNAALKTYLDGLYIFTMLLLML